jgi:hypothetical protein
LAEARASAAESTLLATMTENEIAVEDVKLELAHGKARAEILVAENVPQSRVVFRLVFSIIELTPSIDQSILNNIGRLK